MKTRRVGLPAAPARGDADGHGAAQGGAQRRPCQGETAGGRRRDSGQRAWRSGTTTVAQVILAKITTASTYAARVLGLRIDHGPLRA